MTGIINDIATVLRTVLDIGKFVSILDSEIRLRNPTESSV